MSKFEVIVNKCIDGEFENETKCDVTGCNEKGTVAVIFGRRICKMCLNIADVCINRAILNTITPPPYKELPTHGLKRE